MAETTLQLGFVPKNRGEYQSTPVTRYYKDNVVQYNGSSYIADPVGWSESDPTATYVTVPPTDASGNLNAGWRVFASGNNTFTTGEKVDNVGIDNEPTANSNNLVKSKGVQKELTLGAVYDVSAKNPTAGPNNDGKWESLSALLSDANLNTIIPTSVRKGGVSIKFVQSSDNKYAQYFCNSQIFTTNILYWQNLQKTINTIDYELNGTQIEYDNSYLDSMGNLVANEGYMVSGLFPITPLVDIIWVYGDNMIVDAKLVTYKASGEISDYYSPIVSDDHRTVSPYGNAVFARISIKKTNTNETQVIQNNSVIYSKPSKKEGLTNRFNLAEAKLNKITGLKIDNAILKIQGYFIHKTDGTLSAHSEFDCSDYIEVNEGESYICQFEAQNNAVVGFYDNNKTFINGSYWQKNGYLAENVFVVPAGAKYARFSNRHTIIPSPYFILRTVDGDTLPELADKINNSTNNEQNKDKNYLLIKDRSSVNFSFDDSTTQDSDIKAAFDEEGVKCGFAILNANPEYRQYANEGFEILAHSTGQMSADTTTEEEVRTKMVAGKSLVESLGVECRGWVTPSSQLYEPLQHITYDYFEYGFTIYKGDVTSNQTIPATEKSYQLWRISLATLLTDYENIIDEVVGNNGVLAVYGHGYEIGDSWTIPQLKAVIEYAKSKTEVLTPYESFIKLFSTRHND